MSEIEFQKVIPDKESSFKAAIYEDKFFRTPLHIHPEFELVIILNGEGLCFCGDYAGSFKPGEITLFGKSLPHFYLSDKHYYSSNNLENCKSIYVQFREEILPYDYKLMPGFKGIRQILDLSMRGISFFSVQQPEIKQLIYELTEKKGFEKVMTLYNILYRLSMEEDYKILASVSYETTQISNDPTYIRTTGYIHNNYHSDISLNQLAAKVGMNKSALCRFFKKITGKSIFEYIIEFRISYASKLVANSDIRISSIAYDSGFKNISHFNNQFKIVTGYTPSQYRKIFMTNT